MRINLWKDNCNIVFPQIDPHGARRRWNCNINCNSGDGTNQRVQSLMFMMMMIMMTIATYPCNVCRDRLLAKTKGRVTRSGVIRGFSHMVVDFMWPLVDSTCARLWPFTWNVASSLYIARRKKSPPSTPFRMRPTTWCIEYRTVCFLSSRIL